MENQQSLGGGARRFISLKGRNVGVETQICKDIIALSSWERVAGVGERNASLTPVGEGVTSSGWSRGFTLAEVLITLGIIGIVAALTFPALTFVEFTNL